MSPFAKSQGSIPPVTKARPGHADLAGAIKYDQREIRNILERSSARETASRAALGAVAKRFLSEFGITIGSYVVRIGDVKSAAVSDTGDAGSLLSLFRKAELSSVRCPDDEGTKRMIEAIEQAGAEGTTLGGVFEIFATGIPPGLGSHVQWDRRIDGLLAQAVMSVQAIKGVEVGDGFTMAGLSGSQVMDEIFYVPSHFSRKTNHAGGIEGGITNGMPVLVRAAMKPIPTLRKPLRSVDIVTKEAVEAAYERSDVCAVPAASVVGEAMAALVLADGLLEKFGGDSMEEVRRNYRAYLEFVGKF
jgi:chorismate synthase